MGTDATGGYYVWRADDQPPCNHDWEQVSNSLIYPVWKCRKCGAIYKCALPIDNQTRATWKEQHHD